jgi:hypothetical protein
MKQRMRRWLGGHSRRAGLMAAAGAVLLVSAPFWVIKVGQAAAAVHAKRVYAGANHPGQAVRDGTMAFIADAPRCGLAKIGGRKPAHGQFCVVRLTVTNDGGKAVMFNATAQRAMGSRGGFYIPDPAADAAANHASDTRPYPNDPQRQREIEAALSPPIAPALAPGASRSVKVVYDVPATVKLTRIDLHASEYTVGVVVLF